jgi:hypothetical protein
LAGHYVCLGALHQLVPHLDRGQGPNKVGLLFLQLRPSGVNRLRYISFQHVF